MHGIIWSDSKDDHKYYNLTVQSTKLNDTNKSCQKP